MEPKNIILQIKSTGESDKASKGLSMTDILMASSSFRQMYLDYTPLLFEPSNANIFAGVFDGYDNWRRQA